jgi:glyoxylase-like metal-dependent hydrolase (beta-lactamase superfamily II)
MEIKELLSGDTKTGSGGVTQYIFENTSKITRITTFCPDIIGPGPTHLYIIDHAGVLTLVDTGIPTDLAKSFFYEWRNASMPDVVSSAPPDLSRLELLNGLKAAGYSVRDLDLIILTHGHPDHFLNTNAILSDHEIPVSMHILDTPLVCNPWGIFGNWVSRLSQMSGTGMPAPWSLQDQVVTRIFHGLDLGSRGLTVKITDPLFVDGPLTIGGSVVDGLSVKSLQGHSPGGIGVIVETGEGKSALICGDVMLNPITPHPDNLLVYLRTLRWLRRRTDIGAAMPGHGELILDTGARARDIEEHHKARLLKTYGAFESPKSIWDIATMPRYFDAYVAPEKFNLLAGLEALVHVELLNMANGLKRTETGNHSQRFQADGETFEAVYSRISELVDDEGYNPFMRY